MVTLTAGLAGPAAADGWLDIVRWDMTTCATDGAPSHVVELSGDEPGPGPVELADATTPQRPGLVQTDDLIDPRGSHGPAALPLGLGGLAVVLLGLGVVGRRRPQGALGTRRTS